MAAVSEALLEILRRNSCAYSWPDRTCIQPALELIAEYHDIPDPSWLGMSEGRAVKMLVAMWGDWRYAAVDWAESNGVAERVDDGDLRHGDIVFFRMSGLEQPANWPRSFSSCAIIGRSEWAHTKGVDTMLPIPISQLDVLTHLRIAGAD